MFMKTYTLPLTFYDDHRSRDLPEDGVSKRIDTKGNRVVVEMDESAFRDIYSDALYYGDSGIAHDMGLPGLASSARATTRALRAQNPELTETIDAERRVRGWM